VAVGGRRIGGSARSHSAELPHHVRRIALAAGCERAPPSPLKR
jgi:ribosomal protein L4